MCKTVQDVVINNVFKKGTIEKSLVTIPKKVLLYTDINEFINSIKHKRFHMLFVGGKVSCTAQYNALPIRKEFNKFNKFIEIIKYAKISENIAVNIGKTLYIYYKEDNK